MKRVIGEGLERLAIAVYLNVNKIKWFQGFETGCFYKQHKKLKDLNFNIQFNLDLYLFINIYRYTFLIQVQNRDVE